MKNQLKNFGLSYTNGLQAQLGKFRVYNAARKIEDSFAVIVESTIWYELITILEKEFKT